MTIQGHSGFKSKCVPCAKSCRFDVRAIWPGLLDEELPDQHTRCGTQNHFQSIFTRIAASKNTIPLTHVTAAYEAITTHFIDLDRQMLAKQVHCGRSLNGHHHALYGLIVDFDVTSLSMLLEMRDNLLAIACIADHEPFVFIPGHNHV